MWENFFVAYENVVFYFKYKGVLFVWKLGLPNDDLVSSKDLRANRKHLPSNACIKTTFRKSKVNKVFFIYGLLSW